MASGDGEINDDTLNERGKVVALLWANPLTPFAFSGLDEMRRYFRPRVSLFQLQKALSRVMAYNIKRKPRKPKYFIPYLVFSKRSLLQADLIQLESLKHYNDGVQYLLNVVDTFSRFSFIRPLLTKEGLEVSKKLESILKEIKNKGGPPVRAILTDAGKEFLATPSQRVMKKWNIKHLLPRASMHANVVEANNKILKHKLFSYLSFRNAQRYIDVLPSLVNAVNSRHHRILRMSPAEGELDRNRQALLETHLTVMIRRQEKINAEKRARARSKSFPRRLAVGTLVRRSWKDRPNVFRKGYADQFNPEICEIYRVAEHLLQPLYFLKTLGDDGRPPKRLRMRFYRSELRVLLPSITKENFPRHRIINRRDADEGSSPEVLIRFDALPERRYQFWFKKSHYRAYLSREGEPTRPDMLADPSRREEEGDNVVVYPEFESEDEEGSDVDAPRESRRRSVRQAT